MRFSRRTNLKATAVTLRVVACALAIFGGINFVGVSSAAGEDSAQGETLVQRGIDEYNNDQLDQAFESFRQAEKLFPESLAVPYYTGLIYLKKGDREKAIVWWKQYAVMAPQDEKTVELRRQITLLLRREAKAYAQKAVAQQNILLDRPVEENAVAVTAFKNMGSESLAPLGKGMAAMIIADLSHFEDLEVVEREKLQALLAEMKLGSSGLLNEKNAPKVGRLLRAKYVAGGSLADPQAETLQIASVLLDAARNASVGEKSISGRLVKFYELEKKIACGIAVDLGQDCARAPKAFGKIHTRSLAALEAYSYGLDYLDEEHYDEARAMFRKAVEKDPQFDLAQAALLATPAAGMLLLTESQMISSASAGAPSATATSTAAATGGVGIGTTAAVAGGVAAAGGAAALAVGMNKESGSSGERQVDLNGQWQGVWSNSADRSGGFILRLTQDGDSMGGEAVITGTDCISEAGVNGSCGNGRVSLNLSSATTGATLTAQTTSDNEMTGDLEFTSGACAGTALQVSVQKTGGAVVEW